MMITDHSKSVIPFRERDAAAVGEGCFNLDQIVWLNGAGIEMGESVKFNHGCYVNGFGGLRIGAHTSFGPGVMIHTANHRTDDPDLPINEQGWETRPVTIGADCWIGMGVIILPGVSIGDRVVVGAGSVVTKDLPSNNVAVGNPARVVRRDGVPVRA